MIFCFCTCAENNKEEYLCRVKEWRNMLRPLAHMLDLYTVVDGSISPDECPEGVTPLCVTPKLGRVSCGDFPGWKRSYVFALRYAYARGYTKIFHCENDVQIVNYDKVKEYLNKEGLYSSIDQRYDWIESAFQIINDQNKISELLKYYDSHGYYEKCTFEDRLQELAQFEYPFTSIRKEEHDIDESKHDFIAQAY